MIVLLILLVSVPFYSLPMEHKVVTVELNHFYDEQGKFVFVQALFYDHVKGAYQLSDFVVLNRYLNSKKEFQYDRWGPFKNNKGDYVTVYIEGILYRIYFDSYKETWTQYDPEVLEREVVARELRIGIPRPIKPDLK